MPKPPYELADKSGQQQFARTMGAIGTNLLDKYLQARQANEESQFIGQVKSAQAGFRNWLQENPQATPEEMFAERDKMVKGIDDISANNKFLPATKNYIKNFIASNKEKMIKDADYDIIAIGMQQQMTQLNANIDLLEMEGDYAGVEKLVDDSPLSQPEKDLAKAKAKVKIDTLNRARDIEAVRANYQAVIDNGGTKEQAYQVVDEGVKLFGLSAKEKETLGNNLDNYVEGRIKKAADSKHEKTMSAYKDFATKLVTTDVSMNDIESAGFDKDVKEGWQAIIKGSTEPAPLATTGVGYSAALDSVISSQVIGKKQAYDEILKARFIDKTINNDTYLWAISRIENPYPKHITEMVKGITKSAESYYYHKGIGILGRDFLTDKEEQLLGEKNAAFISWLENESKDGKYPDGKTMYSKMREIGVAIETPETLPREPIIAPKKADPLYITNDEDYDKLAGGTRFYDALTGQWMIKPSKTSIGIRDIQNDEETVRTWMLSPEQPIVKPSEQPIDKKQIEKWESEFGIDRYK